MKLRVINFRGITDAVVEIVQLTLLAGRNGAGKTSILQALTAAISGIVVPVDGLKSNHAPRLLRTGSKGGEVSLEHTTGTAQIVYPDGKLTTTGAPLGISEHAAGMKSILDEPTKDRAAIINRILAADPTRADLDSALKAAGAYSPEASESIWSTVSSSGWDAAHAHARERGAKLKGQWEAVAGEQYGSKKAESWLPASWDASLWNATEQQLTANVTQENEWLTAALASSAVAASEIERLRAEVKAGEVAARDLDAEKSAVEMMIKNREDINDKLDYIPSPDEQDHSCPSCGAPLSIESGKIIVRISLTVDQKTERRQAIDQAKASITALAKAIDAGTRRIGDLQRTVTNGRNAYDQLARTPAQPVTTDHGSVDDCRARVKRAADQLAAFQTRARAERIHKNILTNQIIVDVLGPAGLRKTKAATAMTALNSRLALLCTAAGWAGVSVSADMMVSYNATPYALASESEQFRCRVTLQAAIIQIESAPVFIIDRADILDAVGRNGLIKLARAVGVPVVIGMTISKRDDVPNVARLGGAAYWVENGTALRV